MQFRIGSANDTYWIEAKSFLRWRKICKFSDWCYYHDAKFLRYREHHVHYYSSYDEAREEAKRFITRFDKRVAVYTNVLT